MGEVGWGLSAEYCNSVSERLLVSHRGAMSDSLVPVGEDKKRQNAIS